MGHCTGSPNKMDHGSPAQNHHYGMRKGESIKQEKYNLEHDNPVAKHASWMSKHATNSRMSPINMGHSPAEMSPYEMGHDSPAEFINPGLVKAIGGAAIRTAKKAAKAVKKVATRVKNDMTGGFEHARARRKMRGGTS